MHLIEKFAEQRDKFEAAYEKGGWEQLRPYFSPDIVYEVSNISFHCKVQGIENFLSGLERATEGFDKKCVREINTGERMIAQEGDNVIVHSHLRFTRDDSPPMETGLWEIATYENGLITRLIDIYDAGCAERFDAWMENWGQGLDPRYQD